MVDIHLLDELEAEHREVDRLLAELADAESRRQEFLVDRVVAMTAEYLWVEETQVLPAVSELDAPCATGLAAEHDVIRSHLDHLIRLTGRHGFSIAVAALRGGLSRHAEHEEHDAFGQLRAQATGS